MLTKAANHSNQSTLQPMSTQRQTKKLICINLHLTNGICSKCWNKSIVVYEHIGRDGSLVDTGFTHTSFGCCQHFSHVEATCIIKHNTNIYVLHMLVGAWSLRALQSPELTVQCWSWLANQFKHIEVIILAQHQTNITLFIS